MISADLLTVTADILLTLSASVSADIQKHWISQRIGSPATLSGDVGATDTDLAVSSAGALGVGLNSIAAGQTVVIDGEAMKVEAIEGQTVTVARNVAPLAPPASGHAAGAPLYVLKYADPWQMIADEALRPWAQQIVNSLGSQSATFGAAASGSLKLNIPEGA